MPHGVVAAPDGEGCRLAASIDDVARRAGVSVATVSRALRGLPNVAPSTRDRVQHAAAELHYVADPHASRLAARRTATVGLVVPALGQWYYAQLFSGAEGALVAEGYDILPFVVGGAEARERFVGTLPFRKRVDGLLVADVHVAQPGFERITAAVPVVTVGLSVDCVPSLAIDNVASARLAVEHLLDLGHERIGLIAHLPDDPFHFAAPLDRQHGVELALADRGLALDPALVVPGNFSFQGGAEAMVSLLELDRPPTAVFAFSDEMAIGALRAARDAGLSVPGELSIVGFDDHDVSHYVGLTTIRQHVAEQGERAVHRLLARIRGSEDALLHERIGTELVVRETTGPPCGVGAISRILGRTTRGTPPTVTSPG